MAVRVYESKLLQHHQYICLHFYWHWDVIDFCFYQIYQALKYILLSVWNEIFYVWHICKRDKTLRMTSTINAKLFAFWCVACVLWLFSNQSNNEIRASVYLFLLMGTKITKVYLQTPAPSQVYPEAFHMLQIWVNIWWLSLGCSYMFAWYNLTCRVNDKINKMYIWSVFASGLNLIFIFLGNKNYFEDPVRWAAFLF